MRFGGWVLNQEEEAPQWWRIVLFGALALEVVGEKDRVYNTTQWKVNDH
jgi:hypothetical protein